MIEEAKIRAQCLTARQDGSAVCTHHELEVRIHRDGRNYLISAGDLHGAPVVAQNVPQVVRIVSEALDRREVWIGSGAPERGSWLEWRRSGLGGSDVAAILGLSPWASAWDVWRSKRNTPEEKTSKAMERGRRLEDAIAEWTRDRLNAKRFSMGRPCQDPERPWMRGTPDGWLDGVGLEIKTTRSWDGWGKEGTDQIPAVYKAQCLWYMAITNRQLWILAAFSPMTDDLRIYEIKADLQMRAAMAETAAQWWKTHIKEGEEPEIDGSSGCAAGLLDLHPVPRQQMKEADSEMESLIDAWRSADASAKQMAAQAKKLQNQIKDLIGDDAGITGSKGHVKWSRYTTSSMDTKALIAARPGLKALLEQYTKTRPASRLSVKWENK